MLGKYVRVKVTHPINSHNAEENITYNLNFGQVEGSKHFNSSVKGAYIMGISHPVRSFDGRVIAVLHYKDKNSVYIVVAPKSTRFINIDIKSAMEFALKNRDYSLECLYEKSCGAIIVYKDENKEQSYKVLLVRNNNGRNYSFPKGHVEKGETEEQTAIREIKEETGLDVEIVDSFREVSDYCPFGNIKKRVVFFMAQAFTDKVVIQKEEIDSYNIALVNAKIEIIKL